MKLNLNPVYHAFWGLLILGLAACQTAASPLTDSEKTAVYGTAIQQVITVDDTFGGTLNPPVVYIINQTDDSVGDPDTEQLPPEMLSPQMQNEITASLSNLEAKVVWVNGRADVTIDPGSGALVDEGVLVTLGNIHPQEDGSLLLPTSIYIAGLAAGGQTYILERVNGQWEITGTTGVRWIS
ncbi:MAG: hypothetical protein H6667_04530 [Ardenticatenaceae bacterium]|nr:hypothetical protein [Ardenticatenaceae bacterium]